MKRLMALAGFALLLLTLPARAQSPDDQYVRVYNLIQSGDALNSAGQPGEALTKFLEAQSALVRLQKQYPDYNVKVVGFRLNYLNAKIAAVTPKVPPTTTVPAVPAVKPVAPAPTPTVPSPAVETAAAAQQLTTLQDEVRRLQGDKSLLESKLKEALATQPASVDPRELIKAAEKYANLSKENDLLKATLADEKTKRPAGPDPKVFEETRLALAEANRKLSVQGEHTKTLTMEKQALQEKVNTLSAAAPNVAALDAARKSLEEANRKLADQAESGRKLSEENTALQTRVRTLMASSEAADALRAENQLLKKQLADAKAAVPVAGVATGSRSSAQAQAQIAALQSDAEILRLEKIALQNRIRQMAAAPVGTTVLPAASRAEDLERIKRLEHDRDELQRKLDVANKEVYGRNSKEVAAKVESLAGEIMTLRARLGVLEARAVPYTTEELALFKGEDFTLAAAGPNAGKKSIDELPAGSRDLVAEAQRHFAAREFDKAEQKYLEILHRDEKNANTLANLATIQLQMNHLDDAEKHIQRALAVAPEDGYNLSVLGYVKFYREKYDEAFDALSRAAKLSPQSAEIQNYLGLTLSHKGMRGPAETALRKAIQIDPGYGAAHNNLAVIYLTQKPPLVELARWHYQKAIAAGHAKNPELEKVLNQKAATASQ